MKGIREKKGIICKHVWIVILLIMTFFIYSQGITAEEKTSDTIKVAFPIQYGLTEVTREGKYSGYTYEYLMEIAKYTNWKYDFVQLEGSIDEQLVKMLEMLENGQLDLMGCMAYSEQLAEIYDYPLYNYGTSYYVLCTLGEEAEVTSSNYYMQSLLRVAVHNKNKIRTPILDQFAQMSGFEIEQVFCDSREEQIEFVRQGKADVLLGKDISAHEKELRSVARFSPTPFYFATTKGNKEIVNELNKALEEISKANPDFSLNLHEKYFSMESGKLTFSKAEQDYMEKKGTLRAVMIGGKPPIQYIDETDGSSRGISVDILKYLSEETGMECQIQVVDSFEEYKDIIINKKADVAIGVTDELLQYDWQKLKTSTPYLQAPISVVLSNKEDPTKLDGKILALSKGIKYDGTYRGKVAYFEDGEECLEAVEEGRADYVYANSFSAQYHSSNPKFKNMLVIPQSEDWRQKYCFGVIDGEDTTLLTILNKLVSHATKSDLIQTSLYENAYKAHKETLLSFLISNPQQAAMVSAVMILLFIVIALLMGRFKDIRNNRIRSLENARYEQISQLSNEYLFEYDIEADRLKLPEKTAEFLRLPRVIEQVALFGDKGSLISCILKAENTSEEFLVKMPSGNQHWIRIITKRITDNENNPIYVVGKFIDIQREKEEKEWLLNKAQKDSLTGVYNTLSFREQVNHILETKKTGYYGLFVLDIDHFKEVNDTYGHYTGDYVLENIGEILKNTMNEKDVVGRLGGDEFLIFILYDGDIWKVEERCRQLQKEIGKISFENQKNPITASIGVALVNAGENYDFLYQIADNALYDVKNKNRNGYKITDKIKQMDSAT